MSGEVRTRNDVSQTPRYCILQSQEENLEDPDVAFF